MVSIALTSFNSKNLYLLKLTSTNLRFAEGFYFLLFDKLADYYVYMNSICDTVDALERTAMTRHSRRELTKIRFCKDFLIQLLEARLTNVNDG